MPAVENFAIIESGKKGLFVMNSKTSTVDLIKRTLDKRFEGQSVSYVTFKGNHLELDLKGFLASEKGKSALEEELDASDRVPFFSGRRIK